MSAVQKHDVFQAIADPTRRKILMLLAKQDLSVTAISGQFPITRTAVSKHLRILFDANLVSIAKTGREKIYKLHPESFTEMKDWLNYFDQFWDNKVSMLKFLVEDQEK